MNRYGPGDRYASVASMPSDTERLPVRRGAGTSCRIGYDSVLEAVSVNRSLIEFSRTDAGLTLLALP